MTECVYWIWFQLLFGIGTRRAELLEGYGPHPQELYAAVASGGSAAELLTPRELAGSEQAMHRARELERRTRKKGCEILTPDHPLYPPLLRTIPARPAALYVKGDLACLQDRLAVAMVGTRRHTQYGRQAAQLLAGRLAENGAVVVSGLAHGIDTECHRAALAAGGETIGVLGCGIDIDYPNGSSALKRAMSKQGAVVSEFPLGTAPHAGCFPLRNRIISGMAHATVVVEAEMKSGSLITARLAREQGREVFAVPGSIFLRREQGAHQLIKEGAQLADDAEDILARYPQFARRKRVRRELALPAARPAMPEDAPENRRKFPLYEAAEPPEPKQLPAGTGETAAQVYALFGRETLTVDELSTRCALATGDILSALTELEIYGLIQSYPGRKFGLL